MKDMMIYIQLPLNPSPACGWPWIRRYDGSRASIPPHHLRDAACVVAVRIVDLRLQHRMSVLGQSRQFRDVRVMSAFPPKADIGWRLMRGSITMPRYDLDVRAFLCRF